MDCGDSNKMAVIPRLLLVLLLGITMIFLALLYQLSWKPIKVIELNTWGMPATFGSEYKTQCMEAIRDVVAKGDLMSFSLKICGCKEVSFEIFWHPL